MHFLAKCGILRTSESETSFDSDDIRSRRMVDDMASSQNTLGSQVIADVDTEMAEAAIVKLLKIASETGLHRLEVYVGFIEALEPGLWEKLNSQLAERAAWRTAAIRADDEAQRATWAKRAWNLGEEVMQHVAPLVAACELLLSQLAEGQIVRFDGLMVHQGTYFATALSPH